MSSWRGRVSLGFLSSSRGMTRAFAKTIWVTMSSDEEDADDEDDDGDDDDGGGCLTCWISTQAAAA
jgi:hypothetical protein